MMRTLRGHPVLASAVPMFAAVALVALVSLLLPPYRVSLLDWWVVGVGLMIVGLVVWLAVVIPPGSRMSVVPPVLFFGLIAVARAAAGGSGSGGSGSGMTALMVLPLMWIVLYGRRWQLWWAAAAAAAVFVVPWLLVGPPGYDPRDWRAAVIWVSIAVLLCPVLQRGVRLLRDTVTAEKALTGKMSSLLRAATEHAIIATDVGSRITVFSPGAEKLLGSSAAVMLGTSSSSLFSSGPDSSHRSGPVAAGVESPTIDWAQLVNGVTDGEAVTRICWWRRADGSSVQVRVTVTQLLTDDGGFDGWMIVGLDITADIAAQTALAQSERRWRAMMEHLPDITVLTVDSDFRYRMTAGAGLRRVGADTFEGHTVADTSNPDNRVTLEGLYLRALRGQPGVVEVVSSRTGAILRVSAVPLPITADEPRQALILVVDVTASRRRETDAVIARDYARRLFDDAPHGAVLVGPDGDVLDVNPTLSTMVEAPVDLLASSPVSSGPLAGLLPPGVLGQLVAAAGGPYKGVAALQTGGGRTVHVEVVAAAILTPHPTGERSAVLVSVVDVSERTRFEQQLAHLADHDPLTGLINRRGFEHELSLHLQRCAREGVTGAVMLLDLDNFKKINDTLGHGAGDELIVAIATLLRQRLRSTDVLARLGGDEFGVLLPVGDLGAAEAVAGDLVDLVRTHTILLGGHTEPRGVTASLGVVILRDPLPSAAELISTADLTMYDAKDNGRDQYALYDSAQHTIPRSGARLLWAGRIEHALAHNRFAVHAQPVLDVATGTINGAELLIRMLGDNDELIMPGQFLDVAELSDLITRIDAYMVRQAALVLESLRDIHPAVRISVNLSGRSVATPHISALVPQLCRDHDIDPANLILEITETAAVRDITAARAFAEDMAELGCRFALDDFGAGFGSFYYLKHLLFDYVKIDGEFVSGAAHNTTDQLIISSIVDIAHGLGKQVVAEFVKDADTQHIVTELGVDKAQGYHIGHPVPINELITLLGSIDNQPRPDPMR